QDAPFLVEWRKSDPAAVPTPAVLRLSSPRLLHPSAPPAARSQPQTVLHRLTPQRLLKCTSLFSREIANKLILQTGNPASLQAITVVSPFAVKPLARQYAKNCPSGPSSAVPERTFRRKSATRRRSSGSR